MGVLSRAPAPGPANTGWFSRGERATFDIASIGIDDREGSNGRRLAS
jgi:hypothetical protein